MGPWESHDELWYTDAVGNGYDLWLWQTKDGARQLLIDPIDDRNTRVTFEADDTEEAFQKVADLFDEYLDHEQGRIDI